MKLKGCRSTYKHIKLIFWNWKYSRFRLIGTPVNWDSRLFGTNLKEQKPNQGANSKFNRLIGTTFRLIGTVNLRSQYIFSDFIELKRYKNKRRTTLDSFLRWIAYKKVQVDWLTDWLFKHRIGETGGPIDLKFGEIIFIVM